MPTPSPYARFDLAHLTLRDALAVDRTIVANERTFLGYVRTTLALLATGGSLLHFLDATWATVAGAAFLASSAPLFIVGTWHYVSRHRALAPLLHLPRTGQ